MPHFLSKRLKIIPFTLSLIFLLNFTLVNFSKEAQRTQFKENLSFELQIGSKDEVEDDFFRSYGLNLPIFFNSWPLMSEKKILKMIQERDYKILKMAPFILEQLSALYLKAPSSLEKEKMARLILRGKLQSLISQHSFGQNEIEASITSEVSQIENMLLNLSTEKIEGYLPNLQISRAKKIATFFCETRFFRYFKKVALLDFGSLRYHPNQKVMPYLIKRFKTSVVLLIIPIVLTFILAQLLGLWMALKDQQFGGILLSLLFAFLYAVPLYIMMPLLIEKVGLKLNLPLHGMNFKSLSYFVLPTLALLYGALAIYSRINKTLYYRILSNEYLFVAKAKGVRILRLLFVHTSREALLTTLPLAIGSIGFFMGGLIIVENALEIEGFGSAFYQAILTHDYNVLVFSTLFISTITMLCYLLSDIILYKLDPRISKNVDQRVFERA